MTGAVLVLISVASAGAGPASDSDRLPLAPGAQDVVVSVSKGDVRVEYDVKEPYPAPITIEFLVRSMKQRGWTVVQLGKLQPADVTGGTRDLSTEVISSLRKHLERRFAAAPLGHNRVWEGRWTNPAGEEVKHTLVYSCPMDSGLRCVYVHVTGIRRASNAATKRDVVR